MVWLARHFTRQSAAKPMLRAGLAVLSLALLQGPAMAERRGREAERGLDGITTLPCRYEIAAIIQGPFCNGSNAPVFARGLSNHDPPWVTGFYTQCTIGPEKAFVWTGSGPLQTLNFGAAGGTYSYAFDVTDTGKVVGSFSGPDGVEWRGFIYDFSSGGPGGFTQLVSKFTNGSVIIRAANNQGMVVGSRWISETAANAFIWHNGVYTDLGVMNGPHSEAWGVSESGIVVGWTGSADFTLDARAFIYQSGALTVLPAIPGGISSSAMAVNEAGDVAGRGRISSPQGWGNVSQAFVRPSGAKMIALPTLSGYRNGFAYDLQDSRIVIGESRTLANGSNGSAACIWRWGVISNLNGLLPSGSGVYLSSAWRINARGELLCEGSSQTGRVAVLLTPIHAPYGDINLDCEVNLVDLVTIIDQWGNANSPADVNGDGIVNVDDLLIVINNWSSAP